MLWAQVPLTKQSGELTTDPLEELDSFLDYYKKLYTFSNPDEITGAQFLDWLSWTQLSVELSV